MRPLLPALLLILAAAPARAQFVGAGAVLEDAFEGLSAAARRAKKELKERFDAPPPPVRVPFAPPSTQVSVGDPWSAATRAREYRKGSSPPAVQRILAGAIFETPFLPMNELLGPISDPFPSSKARAIAGGCKAAHREWWDRIGCVSRKVNEHFDGYAWDANSRDGLRSFCRSHARAFEMAFEALGLERSAAKVVDASTSQMAHVANQIIVHNDTGGAFAYVIDSGWFPGKLFPVSDLAVRLHDRDGNGRSDLFALPNVSENPATGFQPAR